MQLPREVIVGRGILMSIAQVVRRLGLKETALIISGSKSYSIAGKTVRELLESENLQVVIHIIGKATFEEVLGVEEKIKASNCRFVVGVGGGAKIDAAKLGSANQEIPFISVPTTLSHDGIASPLASVKGYQKPYSVMAQAPLAILADTDIIIQAPWRSVLSGCGDAISKFSAVRDWRLATKEKNEYYGDYAASLALMSARRVMSEAELIKTGTDEGLRVLLEALISCGVAMSIAGSSRPCSGSEHLFSHALDTLKSSNSMHGEQCGVGSIIMEHLHGANWQRIKRSLEKIGAPTTAKELGVRDEDILKALEIAVTIRPERYTILHKLNLNHESFIDVAEKTGVIA